MDMDLYEIIGKQIKKTRREQGVGQKVLASTLGYTASTISQYETGKRRILLSDLEKIAMALNRPLTHFISPGERSHRKKGEPGGPRILVSLKQYKMLHAAGKIKSKLKDSEKEATKYKREIEKLESKLQKFMTRIAEQSQITNQTALLYNELKRNEEKIREGEKAISAHKATKDLAYKLNNPLTSLLGFIQVLISQTKTGDPGFMELKNLEKIAKRCIQEISEILNSFKQTIGSEAK